MCVFVGVQVSLRRLVYCAVRVMAGMSQDVIIVTSSLTKDMTGKVGRREWGWVLGSWWFSAMEGPEGLGRQVWDG